MSPKEALCGRRLGIEVELLAPSGATRRDLAEGIASRFAGSVVDTATLSQDGQSHDGVSRFSIRPSFEVYDRRQRLVARVVDDVTLTADLDGAVPSLPNWGRVVSTDRELLSVLADQQPLVGSKARWLAPLSTTHNAFVEVEADGSASAIGPDGRVLALATGLPGGRERPAEVVSPPLAGGHRAWLDAVLEAAATRGFTLPAEAAVHLHFDADPFTDARPFAALVEGFMAERSGLRQAVGTNPACRALGPWPAALLDLVRAVEFTDLDWDQARARINGVGLTKHCDLNLLGVLDRGAQRTIEFRFFPGSMNTEQIMSWGRLAAMCLDRWAMASETGGPPLLQRGPSRCTMDKFQPSEPS